MSAGANGRCIVPIAGWSDPNYVPPPDRPNAVDLPHKGGGEPGECGEYSANQPHMIDKPPSTMMVAPVM
jgi:hypothetical protein